MTEGPTAVERVIVRRVIAASQERVFRSWTDPEQLKQWWGPGGFSCPAAEVDLRPGGTYRLVMLAPGGAPEMSVTGTYRKVDPPALLVYDKRWRSARGAQESHGSHGRTR